MTYKDIDATLIIAEKEFLCVFSFEHDFDPEFEDKITITEAKIYPFMEVDLFTEQYDWLLTKDTFDALEKSAREHLALEKERIESDKINRMVA